MHIKMCSTQKLLSFFSFFCSVLCQKHSAHLLLLVHANLIVKYLQFQDLVNFISIKCVCFASDISPELTGLMFMIINLLAVNHWRYFHLRKYIGLYFNFHAYASSLSYIISSSKTKHQLWVKVFCKFNVFQSNLSYFVSDLH